MTETTPDPTPAAQVTVDVPGIDSRTVTLDNNQVFFYAPGITNPNDPRLRRALYRLAWQVQRSNQQGVTSDAFPNPAATAQASSGDPVVILPPAQPAAGQ